MIQKIEGLQYENADLINTLEELQPKANFYYKYSTELTAQNEALMEALDEEKRLFKEAATRSAFVQYEDK